jgi:hypothetical protein
MASRNESDVGPSPSRYCLPSPVAVIAALAIASDDIRERTFDAPEIERAA